MTHKCFIFFKLQRSKIFNNMINYLLIKLLTSKHRHIPTVANDFHTLSSIVAVIIIIIIITMAF